MQFFMYVLHLDTTMSVSSLQSVILLYNYVKRFIVVKVYIRHNGNVNLQLLYIIIYCSVQTEEIAICVLREKMSQYYPRDVVDVQYAAEHVK